MNEFDERDHFDENTGLTGEETGGAAEVPAADEYIGNSSIKDTMEDPFWGGSAEAEDSSSYEYHYSRPDAGKSFDSADTSSASASASSSYQYYDSPYSSTAPTYYHEFTKKDSSGSRSSRTAGKRNGGLVLTALLCCILSLFSGFAGAWAYNKFFGSPSTTVIYQSQESGNTANTNSDLSFADIVDKCKPSVVEINCEVVTSNGWFGTSSGTAAGSGVIISADGYIVTNFHVIENARSVTVITVNGTNYSGTVYGYDEVNDLAIVKINADGLTPAVIASSSNLRVGDSVFAIGNPLGTLGGTVTEGIISALDREITVDGQKMTLLQTSAAVNHGNSGGGLFNSAGELVGIVNAKSVGEDVEGLGFAIPSDLVQKTIAEIFEKGGQPSTTTTGPVFGFTIMDISSESAAKEYGVTRLGVYIVGITDGFGAQQAGLRTKDYIVSIDDSPIQAVADVKAFLSTKQVGDVAIVQVIRDNRMMSFEVTLMESQG